MNDNTNRLGFWVSLLTSFITIVIFGIAILTPPLSGPFCVEGGFTYPYLDIASRFPRDYIWMYLAIPQILIYVVLMVCIHEYALREKKLYSLTGLSFALITAVVILADYFIQLSVIQPSLLSGENDGIAILTQYNPHGIFIALEDLGYFMMSVAFLTIAPVFAGHNKLERTLRYTFIVNFILVISSFILISYFYGVLREYRFEVAAISFNWISLIISGILLSRVFRRAMKR